MGRSIDISNQVFGRLTAIKYIGKNNHGDSQWLCQCECGKQSIVATYRLRNGHTRSFGCLNKEITLEKSTTHGLSHTKLYSVWKAMLSRCNNPKNKAYKHYGLRGIKVCKEWMDLQRFYDWAMNSGFKKGLELERIDNDGDYEPNNCKWATRQEQVNNTRRNIKIEINGITKTLKQWADNYGLKTNTVQYRYYRGLRGINLIKPVPGGGKSALL